MNCPNCNTLVGEGVANCPNCGFAMPTGVDVAPVAPSISPEVTIEPQPNLEGEVANVQPATVEMPELTVSDVIAPVAPAVEEVAAPAVEVANETIESAPPVEPVAAPVDPDAYKVNAEAPVIEPEQPVAASLQMNNAPVIEPAITPETPATTIEPATEGTQTEVAPVEKKKSILPVLIIILLALVLVAVALLYSRGFFDSLLGKNNNANTNQNTDVINDDQTQPEPEPEPEPEAPTSVTISGYEFSIPENYTYSTEEGLGHLKNADDTVDIVIKRVYKGQKEELKAVGNNARAEYEKAGYTFNTSRSGLRNGKDYLHIGYTKDGNKYETILMTIDETNILEILSAKPAGITEENFIQFAADLINTKAESSAPEEVQPVSESLVFTSNQTY